MIGHYCCHHANLQVLQHFGGQPRIDDLHSTRKRGDAQGSNLDGCSMPHLVVKVAELHRVHRRVAAVLDCELGLHHHHLGDQVDLQRTQEARLDVSWRFAARFFLLLHRCSF